MPDTPLPRGADGASSSVAQENLRTVAEMEEQAKRERTLGERTVDAVVLTVGNVQFWAVHVIVITLWVSLNSGLVPGLIPWDPWPYRNLLTLLPLEAILISSAVLMIQGRMKLQQAQRMHLDLQISLLQEREATKTLELLRAICRRLDLPEAQDRELAELIRVTNADRLQDEVKDKIVST